MYKLKFTSLQQGVLRLFFANPTKEFNGNGIARALGVSQTAVHNTLGGLEKAAIVNVQKDNETGRLSIRLNRENTKVVEMKRVENLRSLYDSGFVDALSERFPGETMILFGSYSFGEDIETSDIDIVVIGGKEKPIDTGKFEKVLGRKISSHFYQSLAEIPKNLRENVLSGILLKGSVRL